MPEITGQIRMIFQNAEEKKIPARLTLKGFDGYFNTFEKTKVKDLQIGDEVKIEYTVKTTAKGTLNNIDSIELLKTNTPYGPVATKWPEPIDVSNQIDLNKLPDKERVKDKQAIIDKHEGFALNKEIAKNMKPFISNGLTESEFVPADLLKSDPKSEHIDNAVILKELASTYIEGMDPKSEEDFEFLAKKFRKFLNTGNWI